MFWQRPYNPTPYDDDLEDQPGQGPYYQWGIGVVVAGALMVYGVAGIVTQHANNLVGRGHMAFQGINAIAYGIAAVAVGVFLHCHFFWGNIYNQHWAAVLGKIVAAIAFIGGLGVVLVRNGVLGIR